MRILHAKGGRELAWSAWTASRKPMCMLMEACSSLLRPLLQDGPRRKNGPFVDPRLDVWTWGIRAPHSVCMSLIYWVAIRRLWRNFVNCITQVFCKNNTLRQANQEDRQPVLLMEGEQGEGAQEKGLHLRTLSLMSWSFKCWRIPESFLS